MNGKNTLHYAAFASGPRINVEEFGGLAKINGNPTGIQGFYFEFSTLEDLKEEFNKACDEMWPIIVQSLGIKQDEKVTPINTIDKSLE